MSQCTARSKASGERCRRDANRGATVCHVHGAAAPQVMAKAKARVAIAQLINRELTEEERRHPWDIMIDAVQRLDLLMRAGRFETDGAYVDLVERVVRAVKLLNDARVAERVAYAKEQQVVQHGQLLFEIFIAAFDHVIDALPIPAQHGESYRQWALGCAIAKLAGQPMPARPVLPYAVEA